VDEAVDHCNSADLVTEDLAPAAEGQVPDEQMRGIGFLFPSMLTRGPALCVAEYPDAHSDAHSPAAEQVRMKYLGVTGPVDRVATGGAGCGRSTVGPPWAETPGVKQGGQAGARRRFCGQSSGLGSRIDGCFEAR
jgi:hypothetical protein